MVSNDNVAPAGGSNTFVIALLGYSRKDFDYITRLINLINLNRPLKLGVSDLAKSQNVKCDLAIAILDNVSNIERYNKDVAQIKQASNPIIICAAREADRQVLESHRSGLKADSLIFMPTSPEHFIKVIQQAAIDTQPEAYKPDTVVLERVDSSPSAGKIGDLFVKSKLIKQEQLEKALDFQRKNGGRLGNALIELGFITEEQKITCLAEQLKCAVAEARQYAAVDLNTVALVPEHLARRFNCLALEKHDNELIVAVTDVLDLKMLDALRDTTDMRIIAILGKKDDITTSIDRCYRDISSHNDASRLAESIEEQVEFVQSKEEEADIEDTAAAGAELGIIKLVNILITNAIRDRASDIHIEPMENEVVVRYRIDGDMRRVMSPPKRSHHAIVARIKILSDLNIAERRLPQDGRMMIKMGSHEVDIRVSILPTIFGEKAVLRILDKEAFEKSTANLGFTQHDEQIFRSQIAKPYGIIIVTGPTGSGKSTTLYSALQVVKNVTKNIITVEDPVEFHMDGINQVHVNTKTGLTFGVALRSILRQDPDVILIGEIRDNETADIAIKMALTGHLVFSTLHTNDAASSIARFTDIGIPPLLLGSSLNLIVAQRLVRRICVKCKTPYTPDPELVNNLGLDPANVPQLWKGSGCVTCNGTGFSGRIAIFEMMQVSKAIRKMILRNASTIEIQEQAESEGMKTLRKSGIELALNGTTTIEQVIAATIEI
ncbi:MAG: Flp pilus assembly complex ATPase component TadA [Chitinispirillia bacterium]|nr:Flp pilus assembly complex ATPase component TadA [Chitinispirillia bacterium]MCL2241707.1 Flp pilus assembly complex ATPase component TadA [Chitinispirillia bacterium]